MKSDATARFFEDYAVGDRFETGTYPMTFERIVEFAAVFDPQPFHVDEARAKESVFGKLVASGWHTTSVTMKLLVESGVMQATGILGLGVDDLSWPQPVLPGDVLRVRWEVVERSPSRSGNRGLIRTLVTTLNQRDEVVMTMRPKLLVPAQSVG